MRHKILYDKIRSLNAQLRGAQNDINAGIDVKEASRTITDIHTFLKPDVERGLIYLSKDCSEYFPSFCEYCRERNGVLIRPRHIHIAVNIGTDVWDKIKAEIEEKNYVPISQERADLKKEAIELGVPEGSRLLHFYQIDGDGIYHAMFCPVCKHTSGGVWEKDYIMARYKFDLGVEHAIMNYYKDLELGEET